MRMKTTTRVCAAMMAMAIGSSCAQKVEKSVGKDETPPKVAKPTQAPSVKSSSAPEVKPVEVETSKVKPAPAKEKPAFKAVENPLEHYTAMLKGLQEELSRAVPAVDEQKKAAFLEACEAKKKAEAQLKTAQNAFGKINKARGLVGHAKGHWIGSAERAIAAAQAKLKAAKTDAERDAAKKELAGGEKWKAGGVKALKERQALLDKALLEEPKLKKDLEAAKEALALAQAGPLKALAALNLGVFLSSDDLDAKLAKYVVLLEATPKGLAEYAQQGEEQGALIEQMLADTALLKQMVMADGAKSNKYGPAMKIYTDIQNASAKAGGGVLQRLALAISLEHAVPLGQRNAQIRTDAPKTVDPVKRYLHYKKAYLGGELDPAFENQSVWDLRMVVDGSEPDETLAWGREMLRNYRPDHITNTDYRWRYVGAVKTDIPYTRAYRTTDKDVPELQFFQNILMNGGICGRRAFFGRFMLRAFGIPTAARPSPGHGALAHWTPKGWVVCLGGGWGAGNTRTRYGKDLDFLASTQARDAGEKFLQVKRAQWIGDVLGEKRTFGLHAGALAFWNGVALYVQKAIIEEAKAVALAAVGTDIGEANESKVKEKIKVATMTDEDRRILVGNDGVIAVPASACSRPTNNTRKIKFMPSNLGGFQLHYGRLGGNEEFEYTFDAPKAGRYALAARIVTPSRKQHLFVAANGAKKPIDIALPNTVGMWDTTEPVTVTLVKGRNVLKFSRAHQGLKGLTIRDFTLTPVK